MTCKTPGLPIRDIFFFNGYLVSVEATSLGYKCAVQTQSGSATRNYRVFAKVDAEGAAQLAFSRFMWDKKKCGL